MENVKTMNYTHESGLVFSTERLMSTDEKHSYDINVVCLFLPGCATTPLIMIDYYCGEANEAETKRCADNWLSTQSADEIQLLVDCQK